MTTFTNARIAIGSSFMRVASAVALCAMLGAPVSAADARLRVVQDGPQVNVRSSSTFMSRGADGTTFELRIENGEVAEARLNGEAVPPERVRQTPGGIEVLDERGAVIHRFAGNFGGIAALGRAGGGEARVEERRGGRAIPGGVEIQEFREETADDAGEPRGPARVAVAGPSSMLGLGFGAVDEALAHHLGIADRSKCTMITEVIEGLPAKTAGLARFDVITAINDGESAAVGELRDRIAKAAPGTRFALTVRRGGETKKIDVETIAFDPAKLGALADRVEPEDGGTVLFFVGPDGKRREIRLPAMQGLDLRGLEIPGFEQQGGPDGAAPGMFDPQRLDPMLRDFGRAMEDFKRQMEQWDQRLEQRFRGSPDGGAPRDRPAESPREQRLREMEERLEQLQRELRREREAREPARSVPDA